MHIGGAPEDTICAIATPIGEGGIGVVRISGIGALSVAEQCVRLRSHQPLALVPSHSLHLADILAPPISSESHTSGSTNAQLKDQIIDEGLVVYMKGPRSFTAEDVVEIHSHGNGVVLGRICEACIAAGARLAQPGEFTKRAFLNGRLDLSQAEAILDTIKAKSDAALKIAQRHLRGELGQQVDRLRGHLLGILAHLEAGIDFVEEEIAFIGRDEVIASLQRALDEIHAMLSTAERGRVLREGARVVIMGRPNVGKSSLLNILLREDRAIVSNVPGTTRDVIEETVVWDGLMITLVDTAGLRETSDRVEQEGMRRTRAARDHADLVLHVCDATEVNEGDGYEIVAPVRGEQNIVLLNKTDLVGPVTVEHLVGLVRHSTNCRVLPISVRTGEGLEELQEIIRSSLSQGSLESGEGVGVTNVRHRQALERAGSSLREALDATVRGIQPECVAVDLRGAADFLGEITGVITSDEVLEQIFSEFCIGK